MEIINIITTIAEYFGLDILSLMSMALGITVLVNFLKATPPFSSFVEGSVVPVATFALAFIVSAVSLWGNWLPLLISGVLIGVLSIGGWATAKMLAHKVGTPPSNKSGGGKK